MHKETKLGSLPPYDHEAEENHAMLEFISQSIEWSKRYWHKHTAMVSFSILIGFVLIAGSIVSMVKTP